jgi:nucleolar pre-ribosomal-associated protein 1
MASPIVARAATLAINDPLRTSLAKCIKALSMASPYVACQPNFVEPLMGLYGGTDSAADLDLFAVLKLFETYRKLSVASMFLSWTPRRVIIDPTTRRSLDVLTSLDSAQVFATCTHFDVGRSGSSEKVEAGDGSLYDVVFILSLTAMVVTEGGLTGLDWVEILRSNVLGLAICALSSRRNEVRDTAGYILAKAMVAIEVSRECILPKTRPSFSNDPIIIYRSRRSKSVLLFCEPCECFATLSLRPPRLPLLDCPALPLSFSHIRCDPSPIHPRSFTL